jgi:hypothetical protein
MHWLLHVESPAIDISRQELARVLFDGMYAVLLTSMETRQDKALVSNRSLIWSGTKSSKNFTAESIRDDFNKSPF